MIHAADTLRLPGRISADLCVVGSGPGGLSAATVAAEAGLRVVLLEAGELVRPGEMNQREEDMLPRLMWAGGARTTADRKTRVLQGRGVGGSSLHNINLCKRIPPSIRAAWARDRGVERVPWEALYAEVEALLGVQAIDASLRNPANRLLQRACEALGWAGGGLQHNRTGCVGSGFCEVGCAFDAKNNALKVLAPRFIAAGGQILSNCQAQRVRLEGGRAVGVEAVAVRAISGEPVGAVRVDAPRVCLAASATGTASLLLRSEVPDPGGETGSRLHLHPGLALIGDFDEPLRAWSGIPQSYECTEWLDFEDPERRIWILPAFGHPASAAAMVPGHGAQHREWMTRYDHLASFSLMLHDEDSVGRVGPEGELGLSLDYEVGPRDRAQIAQGLRALLRLLFAAGARRVLVPSRPPIVLGPADPIEPALDALAADRIELTAAHPMATVPMGADPARAAVDDTGRHHHVPGLWVADGSRERWMDGWMDG